ncbi:MAG: hypothetical protein K8J31_28015 [Anaerolineae bacterium]|nr:hypothetical protein [Anaerolineae bacterium]
MTKSFQTTTILYYTFFLPGVFLHEFSYWFAAGILNVHASGSIKWPAAQEIAQLDLSFVELTKNISPFRLALITLAPIVTGLSAVWLIANNILRFDTFFVLIGTGRLADLSTAVGELTSTADFWLWIYLLFAISNTMIPRLRDLRGLRIILTATAIAAVILIFIGVGNQVVVTALVGPVASALNLLSGTFVIIILIDLLFVVVLGTIEAVIERITGDSAMFRRGKLIAMTRQEVQEMRQRQNRRESRAIQTRTAARGSRTPSIYNRPLIIPGPPGEEPVTQSETVIVEMDEKPSLASGPRPDSRRGPDLISGTITGRLNPTLPALSAPVSAEATAADAGLNTAQLPGAPAPEVESAEALATSAEPDITPAAVDAEPQPDESAEQDVERED